MVQMKVLVLIVLIPNLYYGCKYTYKVNTEYN